MTRSHSSVYNTPSLSFPLPWQTPHRYQRGRDAATSSIVFTCLCPLSAPFSATSSSPNHDDDCFYNHLFNMLCMFIRLAKKGELFYLFLVLVCVNVFPRFLLEFCGKSVTTRCFLPRLPFSIYFIFVYLSLTHQPVTRQEGSWSLITVAEGSWNKAWFLLKNLLLLVCLKW